MGAARVGDHPRVRGEQEERDALIHGEEGHEQQINDFAVPRLRQETLNAQSANIDTVGGATVTSDGYRRSLQSALDAARP